MPEESQSFSVHVGKKLVKDFGLSIHAIGAITGSAGAVWPYRLITRSLNSLLQKHPISFSIRQNCPVTSIRPDGSNNTSPHPYELATPNGTVRARHIGHCTNAHVGHLVPGFRGRVIPLRGQMSAQSPGGLFVSHGDKRSWPSNFTTGFDYLKQLPKGSKDSAEEAMLGGGWASMPYHGVDEIGVATDDKLSSAADIHLSGALSAVFGRNNWDPSEGVKSMWVGTMGFSPDGLPWVGELPASLTKRVTRENTIAAEWTAAGFCGEGMVQAWGSGNAIALMLLQKEGLSSPSLNERLYKLFPAQLAITEDRISREVLPKHLNGAITSKL